MRVLKFRVEAGTIKVPAFTFLSLQMQNGEPVIWLEVDESTPAVDVQIITIGTGWSFIKEPRLQYIGTYQQDWFVGHVYLKTL